MEQEEIVLTINTVKQLGLDKLEIITSDMLEGYTSIGNYAFSGSTDIISITIPNSVTSIGEYVFYGCSSIKSIIIPNSVISIGFGAFAGCLSLTSITIPNSVTSIGDYVFAYCRSLKSIKIPNSVISIGGSTFERSEKLKNVVIGDKTYKTQKVVDGKCKAYKAFNGDLTCRDFQYEEGKTYEIEDEPILCEHGFHACLNLTDVFRYYFGKIGKYFVVHEVELEGVSDERNEDDSKVVAKKITIGKRIL